MQYDDLFPKPLDEMTDAEVEALSLELKKKRKYPAIQKSADKKSDDVAKLINKFTSKVATK
jgi:hypothetical protein